MDLDGDGRDDNFGKTFRMGDVNGDGLPDDLQSVNAMFGPKMRLNTGTGSYGALDAAVAKLPVSFAAPAHDVAGSNADYTYALGYSYSEDPNFMYCAEDMATESADDWWLGHCGLSGGSSGGPWVQGMSAGGSGDIVSVNSWGYTNQPGMAGPKLFGTTASCVFSMATAGTFISSAPDGDEGTKVTCP